MELEPGKPHTRTRIETALREGLVREVAPGIYEDVPGAALRVPAEAAQQAAGSEPQAERPFSYLDTRDLEEFNSHMADIPQGTYEFGLANAVKALAAGESLDGVARAVSAYTGLDPNRASEAVAKTEDFYRRNLARDLLRSGLLTEDAVQGFYEFAYDHPKVGQAVSELLFQGNTSTFRAMALEFKTRQSEKTEQALRDSLQRAGFETRVDPSTGELLIRSASGPWVPLSKMK